MKKRWFLTIALALVVGFGVISLFAAEPGDPTPKCSCSGGPGTVSCSCAGSIGPISWDCSVECAAGYYACCTSLFNDAECRCVPIVPPQS